MFSPISNDLSHVTGITKFFLDRLSEEILIPILDSRLDIRRTYDWFTSPSWTSSYEGSDDQKLLISFEKTFFSTSPSYQTSSITLCPESRYDTSYGSFIEFLFGPVTTYPSPT